MNRDRLVNHVLTLSPDTPTHVIAAHLLELVETMRTEGKQAIIPIPEASGQKANIPTNVINVITVMANGEEIPQTLPSDKFVYTQAPVDWGLETYYTDANGNLLMDRNKYITWGTDDE